MSTVCHAGVTREGEYVDCGKPAVGFYLDITSEEEGWSPYPVCVFHLQKDGAVAIDDPEYKKSLDSYRQVWE